MSFNFSNLSESVKQIEQSLTQRGIEIIKTEQIVVDHARDGHPILHARLWTQHGVYQIKYQKTEHIPLADHEIRTAHIENERLKYAIRFLGSGNETDIGVNESVLFELLNIEEEKLTGAFLLNAVGASRVYQGSSIVYWCRAKEFYEFAVRWGTVIYNSVSYGGTVFLVPTGWMRKWVDILTAPPALVVE